MDAKLTLGGGLVVLCSAKSLISLIFSQNYNMPLAVNFPGQALSWCTRLRVIAHLASAAGMAACITLMLLQTTPAQAQSTVLAPTQPNNDFQEASILYRTGKHDAAMERIDAWLKTRPKDARGRFLRAMIFTQQRKVDEAVKIYIELSQDFPELPEPYNNLAVIHADRGEFDKARAMLESAVRANPAFPAAHENLGDIHARLAAQSYENALKLDATNKVVSAKLKAVNDMIPSRAPSASGVAPAAPVPTPAPTPKPKPPAK